MCVWSGTGIALEVTQIRRSGGGCLLVMDWRIGCVSVDRHCIGDGVARVDFRVLRSVPGTKSPSVETLHKICRGLA